MGRVKRLWQARLGNGLGGKLGATALYEKRAYVFLEPVINTAAIVPFPTIFSQDIFFTNQLLSWHFLPI